MSRPQPRATRPRASRDLAGRPLPLALALAALLTGTVSCARTVAADSPPAAVVGADWPGCRARGAFSDATDAGPPGTGSIPPGFQPRTAVLCGSGERPDSDGDPAPVKLERRATQIQPLLDYLAQPSQRSTRPDDVACPTLGWGPPWLFLVDGAGNWVTPRVPTDPCGFALQLFEDEGPPYDDLDYTDQVIEG